MSANAIGTDSANLHVERNSERDIKMRDLYVVIDDLPERTLMFGESFNLAVSPGEHRIRVSNRLFRDAASFQARPGESVKFEATNIQKHGLLNALAFINGSVVYKPVLRRV